MITYVMWTADGEVSLTVCWNHSLNALQENITDISLNGIFPGVLDAAGSCALFNVPDSDSKLSSNATKYIVDAKLSNGSSMTASATFAMTGR